MSVNETQRFLTALFGDVPEDARFLLWSLPDKMSRWYRPADTEQAAAEARGMKAHDVYVGAALSTRDRGARQRLTNATASGIVGLWCDVDFEDETAHKKPNLPPDLAAAVELVNAMGVEPSALVHSGHGVQAWWLFAEPWLFDRAEERAEAAALANRWHLTLKLRAQERGYVIDSTFDLARVLRVPGTTNRKAEPVPVKLAHLRRKRFNPSDLEQYLADETMLGTLGGRRTYSVGELALHANAQPDLDKLEALRENDSKFKGSWDRARRDMSDQSASSYDLSLATIAASAGWADQEIVDLLIASRRRHRDDLKLRQDYYARTIQRARDDQAREQSSEEIEAAQAQVERAEAVGDERGIQRARRTLLDHLSSMLGVEITRFVRFTQDPPRYRMETTAGAVTMGHADVILSQNKMRASIAGATRLVIPRFGTPRWHELAQAIFSACEDEDTGIESTDEGVAFAWLTEYLQDRPILDDPNEAARTQTPFQKEDDLYIFGSSFQKWLRFSRGDRVSPNRMGEALRAFGCEHTVVNVVLDGRRTSRSAWLVPGLEDALEERRAARRAAAEADARHVPASENGQVDS